MFGVAGVVVACAELACGWRGERLQAPLLITAILTASSAPQIDTFEGVNGMTRATMALHTTGVRPPSRSALPVRYPAGR